MVKLTGIIVVTLLLSCTSSMATSIMTDIADAGIYCDSFSPGISKFYEAVRKKCLRKHRCSISATMVTSRKDLLQHKCTGFFAAPVCNGSPKNVETHKIFSKLSVACGR